MKKFILSALPLLVCASSTAFAEGTLVPDGDKLDSSRALLSWSYDLPVVVPGKAFTLTGRGGKDLEVGKLQVFNDGTFKSEKIQVELHTFDEDTYKPGSLVSFNAADNNGNTVTGLNFTLGKEGVTLASSDGTKLDAAEASAKVYMDGHEVNQEPVKATGAKTQWTIDGTDLPDDLDAGSNITATTYIFADVTYAEAST